MVTEAVLIERRGAKALYGAFGPTLGPRPHMAMASPPLASGLQLAKVLHGAFGLALAPRPHVAVASPPLASELWLAKALYEAFDFTLGPQPLTWRWPARPLLQGSGLRKPSMEPLISSWGLGLSHGGGQPAPCFRALACEGLLWSL